MTTRPYYECHITFTADDRSRAEMETIVSKTGWTFSAIDNDIILGQGVKMYATKHFNERMGDETVKLDLQLTASVLKSGGLNVIRMKIEKVIYDERIKP